MDKVKTVLLYGDSFFWGVDGVNATRHNREDRIGVICQQELGEVYEVITEGLRGRTMFGENGYFPERDGLAQFGPIFASHLPIDAVVIMLGTNDLNTRTNHSADEIASALEMYVEKMRFWCNFMKYPLPKVVVIAPPHIDEQSLVAFKEIFKASDRHIDNLAETLQHVSLKNDFTFIDSRSVVASKNTDGIHLDAENNKKLALEITKAIQDFK